MQNRIPKPFRTVRKRWPNVIVWLLAVGFLGQPAYGVDASTYVQSLTFTEKPIINSIDYGAIRVSYSNGGWTHVHNAEVYYQFNHGVTFFDFALPPWVKQYISARMAPVGSVSLDSGYLRTVSNLINPVTVSFPWDGLSGLLSGGLLPPVEASPMALCHSRQQQLIGQGKTEEETLTEGFTRELNATARYLVRFENPDTHGEDFTTRTDISVPLTIYCLGTEVSMVKPPPLNKPPATKLATAETFQLVDADLQLSWDDPAAVAAGGCPAILNIGAQVRSNIGGSFKTWVQFKDLHGKDWTSKKIAFTTDTPAQGGLVKKTFDDKVEMPSKDSSSSGNGGTGGAAVFGAGIKNIGLNPGGDNSGGLNAGNGLKAANNQLPSNLHKVWVRVHAATPDFLIPNDSNAAIGGLADSVELNAGHVKSGWRTASITCDPVQVIDTPTNELVINQSAQADVAKSNVKLAINPQFQNKKTIFGAKLKGDSKTSVAFLPPGRTVGKDKKAPLRLGTQLPGRTAPCPPPNRSCKYNENSSCWYNCQMDGGLEICDICVKSSGGGAGSHAATEILSMDLNHWSIIKRHGRTIKGRIPDGHRMTPRKVVPLAGKTSSVARSGNNNIGAMKSGANSHSTGKPDSKPTRMATRAPLPQPIPQERKHIEVTVSRLAQVGRTNLEVEVTNTGNMIARGCTAEATLVRRARTTKKSKVVGTIPPGESKKVTITTLSRLSALKVSVRAKCRGATSMVKRLK